MTRWPPGFLGDEVDLKLADLGGLWSEYRSAKVDRGVEERHSTLCGRSIQGLAQGKSGLLNIGASHCSRMNYVLTKYFLRSLTLS